MSQVDGRISEQECIIMSALNDEAEKLLVCRVHVVPFFGADLQLVFCPHCYMVNLESLLYSLYELYDWDILTRSVQRNLVLIE